MSTILRWFQSVNDAFDAFEVEPEVSQPIEDNHEFQLIY